MASANDHEAETDKDHKSSCPTQGISALALPCCCWLAVEHQSPENHSRDSSTKMGHIVDAREEKPPQNEIDNPSVHIGTKLLHSGPAPAKGDGKEYANQTDKSAGCADAKVTEESAKHVPADSGSNVNEQEARRAIQLFKNRAEIDEHPHVKTYVHEVRMQKTRSDETPRLTEVERQRKRCAEPLQNSAGNATDAE